MIASNSSPLIVFGKQGALELLKKCFHTVFIPQGVYDEVLRKKENVEVVALENAVKDSWIVVRETVIDESLRTHLLGKGEKEALSLARKQRCVLLIDDNLAKLYAPLLSIETHGSLYVLLVACKKKVITYNKAKEIFESMI